MTRKFSYQRILPFGIVIVVIVLPAAIIFQPLWAVTWINYKLNRTGNWAVKNTPALVAESHGLLHKSIASNSTWFGNDPTLPPHINQIKASYISRLQGDNAMQYMITGGLYHTGLVIVDDPTTFTEQQVPFEAKQLNDHIWLFRE